MVIRTILFLALCGFLTPVLRCNGESVTHDSAAFIKSEQENADRQFEHLINAPCFKNLTSDQFQEFKNNLALLFKVIMDFVKDDSLVHYEEPKTEQERIQYNNAEKSYLKKIIKLRDEFVLSRYRLEPYLKLYHDDLYRKEMSNVGLMLLLYHGSILERLCSILSPKQLGDKTA